MHLHTLFAILVASAPWAACTGTTPPNPQQKDCGEIACRVGGKIKFLDLGETSYNSNDPQAKMPVEYEPIDTESKHDLIKKTEDGYVKGICNHGFHEGIFARLNHCDSKTPRAWLGIPYADPPTGENRLRPPRPFSGAWKASGKVRKAYHPPKACLQKTLGSSSENCLYLNVFAPPAERIKGKGPLPVMLWIHGGGFNFGSGDQWGVYDGRYWTKSHDLIVVTFNYRLGPLGFLVAEGDDGKPIGNMAIDDQRLAMKWVQDNIAHFGGDPRQVTLVGESAGASSIAIHMLSSKTPASYFHRAVLQSLPLAVHSRSFEQMRQISLDWARNVSCLDTTGGKERVNLQCVRKLKKKVFKKTGAMKPNPDANPDRPLTDVYYWWPHIDGEHLHDEPLDMIKARKFKKVPLLIGTLRQEAGYFTKFSHNAFFRRMFGLSEDFKRDKISKRLHKTFGELDKQVIQLYPMSDDHHVNEDAFVDITTDVIFQCPSMAVANAFHQEGMPVYFYMIERTPNFLKLGRCGKDYACHTWDLPLFWRPRIIPLSTEDKIVSREFIQYTANFIMTGDPNKQNAGSYVKRQLRLVPWEPYTPDKQMILSISVDPHSEPFPRSKYCKLWDKLGYKF